MKRSAALWAVALATCVPVPVAVHAAVRQVAASEPRVDKVATLASHLPAWRGEDRPPLRADSPAPTPPPAAPVAPPPPAVEVATPPGTTPAPAPPPDADPPATVALGVQESETPAYATRLSRTSVPAGDVAVQLQNTGMDPHDLLIVRTDGTGEQTHIAEVAPGHVATRRVTLAPGTYRFSCTLAAPSSHDAAGMHATLTVTGG